MTFIAQLIKASEYACTGRYWYPVQAPAVFMNELSISLSLSLSVCLSDYLVSISLSVQCTVYMDTETPREDLVLLIPLMLSLLPLSKVCSCTSGEGQEGQITGP